MKSNISIWIMSYIEPKMFVKIPKLKREQSQLLFDGAIDVAGGTARWRDENKAKAALLHWRRRGASSASILHGVLENDIALFVHAMEAPQEKATIFNPHQHSPMHQLPHPVYGFWAPSFFQRFFSFFFHRTNFFSYCKSEFFFHFTVFVG